MRRPLVRSLDELAESGAGGLGVFFADVLLVGVEVGAGVPWLGGAGREGFEDLPAAALAFQDLAGG